MQVVKMRSEFRSMALVCTLALGFAGGAARADFAMTNPVTGEQESYTWKFVGTDIWNGTGYWQDSSGANPSGVPAKTGSNRWEPILFDGSAININADMSVEGWNLRLGLYNGAKVRLNNLVKWQGGTTMWATVDENSKFTVNNFKKGVVGNTGAIIKFCVARSDGIEFTSEFSASNDQGATVEYYLTGDGSVKYAALKAANHKIRRADVTLSGGAKAVKSKTLVSFTSTTKTFTADATVVIKDSEGNAIKSVQLTSLVDNDTTLTVDHNVCGDCQLVKTATGVLLYYVDGTYSDATAVSRFVAADAAVSWSDAEWTVSGTPASSFAPVSGEAYDVTLTVGGDCSIAMPASIGSFATCQVNVELAEGATAANVVLKYGGTLPADSTETLSMNPFGAAVVTAGEGVTLQPTYDGDATSCLSSVSGVSLFVAKRPQVGVVSVKIGRRGATASTGCIDPAYSSVGPYPVSGLFWHNAKEFPYNNANNGVYRDIEMLTDAKSGASSVLFAYYGQNTYFSTDNGNPAAKPNEVLTATYVDDSDSGTGSLEARSSSSDAVVNLPSRDNQQRGWQLHFANIPYNAYDVYFITASDQAEATLKETPIYVSLDGGTSWKGYCGDSANEKTVLGTDNWTGLAYAHDGVLVEGKNYIKMRITKSLYGDNIGTIDITHGVRNASNKIRSGLAAIQIVEVVNDGVYTLGATGNWSDPIWSVGSLAGQTWTDAVDGAPSIAKIVANETISSVTVDTPVSAGSVILTGSSPFTVAGDETLSVATGFDASEYSGELTLQAPIVGAINIGANASLAFGGDEDSTLPAYMLYGAGAWSKVGDGTLFVSNSVSLSGVIASGTLEIASSYSGNLTLAGGDLVFAGPTGTGASEIIYSGAAALAANAVGKTTISSGTVQSRGRIATDIDVDDGAKLKLGSTSGFGSGDGTAPSGKTIRVKEGGTVELNGTEGCNAYTLAGGTLQNNGAAIGTGQRQTCALTLTADSTVKAGADFGLIGSGYAATTLDLGGHTLTKKGDAKFWLYNTTVSGGGKIAINAGSVYAHGSLSASGTAFEIAEGATLAARTDSIAVGALSGKGTVDLGQQRPSAQLTFAEGSELTLKVVLASSTEAQVRIPYTGTPAAVEVYESNWNDKCNVSKVSYDGGYIVIDVEVANSTRNNPVTGDSQSFTYAFLGTSDGSWETVGNWYSMSGNRWAAYSGDTAPNITNNYGAVLFDGDLMHDLAEGSSGYKEISNATRTEGWTFRLGLFNHVKVTVDQVKKLQGGCWFWVDETSQLVLGRDTRAANNGGNVDFYVAAKEGVVFNSDYDFTGCDLVKYNFKGDGSVVFQVGATKGTNIINRVKLPVGNPESKLKKLITRKLVSFGSKTEGNVAFDLSQATVTSLDTTLTMEAYEPTEEAPTLTTAERFGKYQLTQKQDGVYITYVGYGVPFAIRLR